VRVSRVKSLNGLVIGEGFADSRAKRAIERVRLADAERHHLEL
jgi:hypothetical protein